MKKVLYSAALIAAMGFANNAKAQLVDESNVTITMDLQPILQLKMTGPTSINFVFDQISEYVGGITQYGVNSLQISSTVSWDLYAVGFASNTNTYAGNPAGTSNSWDQQVVYGTGTDPNAIDDLPIELLELRQNKANPDHGNASSTADYSSVFGVSPVTTGANNIFSSQNPYVRPTDAEKYIAGGELDDDFVVGGSYLVSNGVSVGAGSDYYYTMDYRIVPGLPATFPNAADNAGNTMNLEDLHGAGSYAQPGVYTMNVKYVLIENE